MTSPKHYIPILKWKRAEKNALQTLGNREKGFITPLIELVMPTVALYKIINKKRIKKSKEEIYGEILYKFKETKIKEIPTDILQSWGTNPVYLDFTLLYGGIQLKIDSLNEIASEGINKGLKIIPVLNLNDDIKLIETIISFSKIYNQGICLRIMPFDLINTETMNKKIETILTNNNLSRVNIDLIIDIKEIREKEGGYLKFMNASQKVEKLNEWHNFIFASGAFPENLLECKLDKPKYLPRFDWQNWLYYIKNKEARRKPIFADYTIRYPIFNEALQYYNSTPSIKYTLKDEWLILKGKLHQQEHYLVNAKLLVEDMPDSFQGEDFSWGDKNIAGKARYYHQYVQDVKSGKLKQGKGTGRSTDWIAWGISHHLIMVLTQIASLP